MAGAMEVEGDFRLSAPDDEPPPALAAFGGAETFVKPAWASAATTAATVKFASGTDACPGSRVLRQSVANHVRPDFTLNGKAFAPLAGHTQQAVNLSFAASCPPKVRTTFAAFEIEAVSTIYSIGNSAAASVPKGEVLIANRPAGTVKAGRGRA